ncbi:MAG: hypothetical protein WCI71_02505 [Bacteroidota bacterium]
MLKNIIARQMVKRTKRRRFPVDYLERKHVDQTEPYPNDSSYFYGGDKEGNAFITRMAFREPKRANEFWLDFYLKGFGFYGLRSSPGAEGPGFQQGALKWEPVEVGKIWRVTFEGTVMDKNEKAHYCKINLVFTGDHQIYDFALSSDHHAIASAIASEKWTKAFFHHMKDTHQVHYEQTGTIKGTIVLDENHFALNMMGSRDHSFGSRNWHTWDRHYWITGVSDAGIHWTVTTIKWQFLGRLTAGFITAPDGTTDAIIDCTDLETVSREQLLPDHGMVKIKTKSGKTHIMEFWRHGEFPYLHDGKYMMREGIGSYKFDGIDGVGMVEFGFHADRYKV